MIDTLFYSIRADSENENIWFYFRRQRQIKERGSQAVDQF